MKKKILYVINNLSMGGAENLLINLVKNIDQKKYEPIILILNGSYFDQKLKNYAKIYIYKKNLKNLKEIWKIPHILKLIKKIEPDIVHSNLNLADFVCGILKLLNRRMVVVSTIHGYDYRRLHKKRFWHLLHFKIQAFLYRNYNQIICVSKDLRKYMIEKNRLTFSDIVTIYNGVANINEYREKVNNRKFEGKLLFIGRLVKIKNIQLIINSLAKLPGKYTLTIIGEGILYETLKNLVNEKKLQDRITFKKFTAKLYKMLADYDMLVLPSFHETFSIVALEALLCNLPVICTKVGGVRELVEKTDSNLLVDPYDENELCQKILLVENNYDQIRNKIQKNYEYYKTFNIENTTRQYTKIYDYLMGDRTSTI